MLTSSNTALHSIMEAHNLIRKALARSNCETSSAAMTACNTYLPCRAMHSTEVRVPAHGCDGDDMTADDDNDDDGNTDDDSMQKMTFCHEHVFKNIEGAIIT